MSSEVDPPAMRVVQYAWPTRIDMGPVQPITGERVAQMLHAYPRVRKLYVVAGFPCKGFSSANPGAKGLDNVQSVLLFELVCVIRELERDLACVGISVRFCAECVASMKESDRVHCTRLLGCAPLVIDAGEISHARRQRLSGAILPLRCHGIAQPPCGTTHCDWNRPVVPAPSPDGRQRTSHGCARVDSIGLQPSSVPGRRTRSRRSSWPTAVTAATNTPCVFGRRRGTGPLPTTSWGPTCSRKGTATARSTPKSGSFSWIFAEGTRSRLSRHERARDRQWPWKICAARCSVTRSVVPALHSSCSTPSCWMGWCPSCRR